MSKISSDSGNHPFSGSIKLPLLILFLMYVAKIAQAVIGLQRPYCKLALLVHVGMLSYAIW